MTAAAVVLALICAQAKVALPESLSSKHYDLKTSATRELGQEPDHARSHENKG